MRPPFRADHVGSLLRPAELLAARDALAAGHIDPAELRGIEDDAIANAVRLQEETGLRSVTDGELRRESWHMDFSYQLGAVRKVQDDTIRVLFRNEEKSYSGAAVGQARPDRRDRAGGLGHVVTGHRP